jgi:hypothetical protein
VSSICRPWKVVEALLCFYNNNDDDSEVSGRHRKTLACRIPKISFKIYYWWDEKSLRSVWGNCVDTHKPYIMHHTSRWVPHVPTLPVFTISSNWPQWLKIHSTLILERNFWYPAGESLAISAGYLEDYHRCCCRNIKLLLQLFLGDRLRTQLNGFLSVLSPATFAPTFFVSRCLSAEVRNFSLQKYHQNFNLISSLPLTIQLPEFFVQRTVHVPLSIPSSTHPAHHPFVRQIEKNSISHFFCW